MSRRRPGRKRSAGLAAAAAASLALHATFIAGAGVADRLYAREVRPGPPPPTSATIVTPVPRPPPPPVVLGTPGEGSAFLATEAERELQADREGRAQPNVSRETAAPSTARPADALSEVARQLDTPVTGLPPAPSASDLAGTLAPPTPPEPKPAETADAAPAGVAEEAVAAAPDERDSPAIAETAAELDLSTGRTVSGGDVDFKPRYSRIGIGRLFDLHYAPADTRLVVSVVIDDQGRPIEVVIAEPSGFPPFDEFVERSMWEWWFDPDDLPPGKPFRFGVRL